MRLRKLLSPTALVLGVVELVLVVSSAILVLVDAGGSTDSTFEIAAELGILGIAVAPVAIALSVLGLRRSGTKKLPVSAVAVSVGAIPATVSVYLVLLAVFYG
jgi:hypothetical protein